MIRLVLKRTLDDLLAAGRSMKRERDSAHRDNASLRRELDLAQQARDFYKTESVKWETRASKFIDQVGLKDGILTGPAMQEDPKSRPDTARQMFGALGITALTSQTTESTRDLPTNGAFLGVSDTAAADAVAGVLDR